VFESAILIITVPSISRPRLGPRSKFRKKHCALLCRKRGPMFFDRNINSGFLDFSLGSPRFCHYPLSKALLQRATISGSPVSILRKFWHRPVAGLPHQDPHRFQQHENYFNLLRPHELRLEHAQRRTSAGRFRGSERIVYSTAAPVQLRQHPAESCLH